MNWGSAGRRRRRSGQRGAVLVEFGIIAILLFTLLFGIIEFGWAFVQNLDVRHGAREGARLIAVDYNPTNTTNANTQRDEIIAETCRRMDSSDTVAMNIDLVGATVDAEGYAIVQVRADLDTLTGFFDAMLGGTQLTSTVRIRLEQDASFSETTGFQTCPVV